MSDGGEGSLGWGWGEAVLGRGVSCAPCGEMWAGSSVLMCPVAIPSPNVGCVPQKQGGRESEIHGKGWEKELGLTKSLWCEPQCRPSYTRVKIAVT